MKKTEVIFVGGGHAHVLSLLRLTKFWSPEVSVTLVSDEPLAAYSGMLPGCITKQFRQEECAIDLPALCARLGVRWVEAAAVGIATAQQRLYLADGREMFFDVLSLNVGGVSAPLFDTSAAVAVKPLRDFFCWLERFTAKPPQTLAVIGSGAGGVELALALSCHFGSGTTVALIGESLLPSANNRVRQQVRQVLFAYRIALFEAAAAHYENNLVTLTDGQQVAAQQLVYATPVVAPAWLANSNLALDDNGFVRVNHYLQSVSHSQVFAAGDCAATAAPKSGVVAVRQAPILSNNILAILNGGALSPWRLRQRQLYILNTADGRAIAGWGNWYASGVWLWRWKKWLDKRFMNRFLPSDVV